MPGMSIHVVDVSRGILAVGMGIVVHQAGPNGRREIARGTISAKGTLDHPALDATLAAAVYEVEFKVGDYYRGERVALPAIPFLDVVTFRFGIADPTQHYHLPFKVTPWGYSCFRGGA